MKYLFVFVCILFLSLGASAQRRNQAYERYIERYKDMAVDQMKRYSIPASITLAQGLLESGAGQSRLARKANNHFGIKCHDWRGDRIYEDDDRRGECFRAYDHAHDSYEDHSKFLAGRQRYKALFELKITDYKGWAKGLKKAGYATSPTYANKLIEIIELYELYQYDSSKGRKKNKYNDSNDAYEVASSRILYKFNKTHYIHARQGDTFKSIADELGRSYRALAKYNERDKDDILSEGDIVYLGSKRSKAPKEYKGYIHYVRPGESMYLISQYYCIRLKKLYDINDLPDDYVPQPGDALKLR